MTIRAERQVRRPRTISGTTSTPKSSFCGHSRYLSAGRNRPPTTSFGRRFCEPGANRTSSSPGLPCGRGCSRFCATFTIPTIAGAPARARTATEYTRAVSWFWTSGKSPRSRGLSRSFGCWLRWLNAVNVRSAGRLKSRTVLLFNLQSYPISASPRRPGGRGMSRMRTVKGRIASVPLSDHLRCCVPQHRRSSPANHLLKTAEFASRSLVSL